MITVNQIYGIFRCWLHISNNTKLIKKKNRRLPEKSDYLTEAFNRYWEGVMPYLALKTRDKCAGLLKPHW